MDGNAHSGSARNLSEIFSVTLKRYPLPPHYPLESRLSYLRLWLSATPFSICAVEKLLATRQAALGPFPLQLEERTMPSPIGTTNPKTLQPALELIYLATLHPELASQNLRKLLLANPDYFATLSEQSAKVVLHMNGDTTFESLACVSYIPLLDQLYASIQLKRDWGYSLAIRNATSREYVRFYLSFDRGQTWHNEGLTAFNVNDEPGSRMRIRLVTKRVELGERLKTSRQSPIIRAILSWNSPPPPDAPEWTPLWGNVLDTQIQTVRPDACRTDRLQSGSWIRLADETDSGVRVGRPSDLSDSGPAGVPAPNGPSSNTHVRSEQCSALAR